MTDTGDLKVDGTVSATALEFDDNGTTKNVATELATLRSMIGSSGVSIAGMIVSGYGRYVYSTTLSAITAPKSVAYPISNNKIVLRELDQWKRYISGGQAFECLEEWNVISEAASSPSAYKYYLSPSQIPSTAADALVSDLVSNCEVAGTFQIKFTIHSSRNSSSQTYIGEGMLKFKNGQHVGTTSHFNSNYSIYSDSSSNVELYAKLDLSSMAPLEE